MAPKAPDPHPSSRGESTSGISVASMSLLPEDPPSSTQAGRRSRARGTRGRSRCRRRSRSPPARRAAAPRSPAACTRDAGTLSEGPISIVRYRFSPVAAGISFPMITFSFRPSSRSTLPSIDASVSTFVVSWKEAAERNDSVASDAFVIPRISGSNVACSSSPSSRARSRARARSCRRAGRAAVGVARVLDADLLQHLPDDQLDVLVVDVDALRLVDLLHLADEVQLGRRVALQRQQQVGRVDRALVAADRPARRPRPSSRAAACAAGAGTRASARRPSSASAGLDRDLRAAVGVLDRRRVPPTSASVAAPFGFRASKISTTRGRPCVMSAPATPPVWNVRIVSCVPGSPIDCAAMMPTASPISHSSPVARKVP